MQTRRLLPDTVSALVVASTLGAAGWFAAAPLLSAFGSALAVDSLIATSPLDVPLYRVKLSLAFSLPPVLAWMTSLVHRLRRSSVPGAAQLVLHFALPLGVMVLGMGLRFLWIRAAYLTAVPSGLEIHPSVGSLSVAGWGAGTALAASAVLGVFVALKPHR